MRGKRCVLIALALSALAACRNPSEPCEMETRKGWHADTTTVTKWCK